MKNINLILTLTLLLLSLQTFSQFERDNTILGLNSPNRIANEYIVILDDTIVDQQAQTLAQTNNISHKQATEIVVNNICTELASSAQGNILGTYNIAPYGFSLSSSLEPSVTDLIADNRVRYIEANRVVTASTTQISPPWGLDRIDQQNLPLSNSYTYNQDGTGVNVYVIDSGIRISHNEFGNRATSGFSFIFDGFGTNDCSGHGTHVTGIIGSNTYGVAKNVNLIAVRVLDCNGFGSVIGINDAIARLQATHLNPAIINMSLDLDENSFSMNDRINAAAASGITVVVAAGNKNKNACLTSPASATGSIAVAATSILDSRSVFDNSEASNFGSCVDVFAPGSDITSTWNGTNTATNTISGTSMASPHVAGAAALYLENNPNATPAQVKTELLAKASNIFISNAGTGSPNKLLNIASTIAIDNYENDDTPFGLTNFELPFLGSVTQTRNFVDDSFDFLNFSNTTIACDAATPQHLCKFNFSNIGSANNLCLGQEVGSGFCNIQENFNYTFRPGKGAPILIYNLGTIGANTEYTVDIECGCFIK